MKNFRFIKSGLKSLSNKNGFVRKSVILTFGTAISQAIPVLASPILTRLFTPSEFGLLAIITSITAIISVISTGKYETVILITKNKRDAANVAVVALTISFLVSILAIIIFLFFSDIFIAILKQPQLKYWIFVCPFMSFFISIYQIYNEWCIRDAHFIHLSFNKITNSGSITFANILFGLSKISGGGLIFGELIGRFISAITCIYHARIRDFEIFRRVTYSRMLFLSKRYINAPKFILPGQLINTIAGQGSILLIAILFRETEVGYYSMTGMVLSVPASLISLTIRDVFRQRANEEYIAKKNCLDIYKKTIKVTTLFSIIIFTLLFLIMPGLFSFIFGSKWRVAGEYARILTPAIMISFIAESVWGMFVIAEKMKEILIWQIQFLFLTISSLVIGYYFFGTMKMALICYAIGRSFVYLISITKTYKFAKGLPNNIIGI